MLLFNIHFFNIVLIILSKHKTCQIKKKYNSAFNYSSFSNEEYNMHTNDKRLPVFIGLSNGKSIIEQTSTPPGFKQRFFTN